MYHADRDEQTSASKYGETVQCFLGVVFTKFFYLLTIAKFSPSFVRLNCNRKGEYENHT